MEQNYIRVVPFILDPRSRRNHFGKASKNDGKEGFITKNKKFSSPKTKPQESNGQKIKDQIQDNCGLSSIVIDNE
jgi:hypothetical protein